MPMERQFMDAPTVLPGVMQRLGDPNVCAILDIGGGAYGSHMIAQFEEAINSGNTATLYLVNPYRLVEKPRGRRGNNEANSGGCRDKAGAYRCKSQSRL